MIEPIAVTLEEEVINIRFIDVPFKSVVCVRCGRLIPVTIDRETYEEFSSDYCYGCGHYLKNKSTLWTIEEYMERWNSKGKEREDGL